MDDCPLCEGRTPNATTIAAMGRATIAIVLLASSPKP